MVYKALAEERRWVALQYVQEHRTVTLADLAELVVEQERDERVREIDEEVVRDVYVSLYHVHVPVLEDADLVQYDQKQDLVAATDRSEAILEEAAERLLELGAAKSQTTMS